MTAPSKTEAQYLYQERVDNAVKTSFRLDSDDLEFLKSHADSLAMSIELIFSDGGWCLPMADGTEHLHEAVLNNRRN